MAVDASWTKVIHSYVLFIATALDANNEAINLAWGIAPKENLDHWGWFFQNLSLALPGLDRSTTVIMSDRQKGLNRAVEVNLQGVSEAYCCKHIERNMTGEFGMEVKNAFWEAVYARDEEQFEAAMDKVKAKNERYVLP
jgi:hypothetical protein